MILCGIWRTLKQTLILIIFSLQCEILLCASPCWWHSLLQGFPSVSDISQLINATKKISLVKYLFQKYTVKTQLLHNAKCKICFTNIWYHLYSSIRYEQLLICMCTCTYTNENISHTRLHCKSMLYHQYIHSHKREQHCNSNIMQTHVFHLLVSLWVAEGRGKHWPSACLVYVTRNIS